MSQLSGGKSTPQPSRSTDQCSGPSEPTHDISYREAGLVDFDLNGASPPTPGDPTDSTPDYERVSLDAVSITPPASSSDSSWEGNASYHVQVAPPHPSARQARAALRSHVRRHCCYGRRAVDQMTITGIDYSFAYHYELQTFTERRETSWTFAAYGVGEVDGTDEGTAPLPWDIPVSPSAFFVDQVKCLVVPHTTSVKQCHRCKGAGSNRCFECHGKGWTRCLSCHGDGHDGDRDRCFHCRSSAHGSGRQDCLRCDARGEVSCRPCEGSGLLRRYVELTVTWKVNTSEYIVPLVALPEALVHDVAGQVAYEEERRHVTPVDRCPNRTVNAAAARLVRLHARRFHTHRTLRQRQQIRVVPVTAIQYQWKRHNKEFFIYGYENKIYAPDYPDTCCWGCGLL